MTTEEKAKRYDEAIEIARQIHDDDRVSGIELTTCEEIFPELTESEDERIRKNIIATIHLYYGEPLEDEAKEMIAWLENLCEHKKFRDAIQVGDKVTRNEDGVLVNLSQLNRVAKPADKQGEQKPAFEMKTPEESLGIDSDTYNKIVDECIYGEQNPAWSEEDEAVLDALTRHLEGEDVYVSPHLAVKCLKSLKERVQLQPKQEWSEYDKMMFASIINVPGLDEQQKEWLATCNPQQKQEWSDVDKGILFRTIDDLEFLRDAISKDPKYVVSIIDIEREITWLKSLKDRYTWKPSEMQLDTIEQIIDGEPHERDLRIKLLKILKG